MACDNNNLTTSNKLVSDKLVVDDKDQLIYCPVAKIASSFWKKILQVSSGIKAGLDMFDTRGAHDESLPLLKNYPADKMEVMLNSYTTFLFVREPYSRLLACYIDKLFSVNPLYWRTGKGIIKRFRPGATNASLTCGHDVTFPEFLKYIISDLESGRRVNNHWEPIYRSCSPCQVHFDIIGKLETFSQDFEFVFENFLRYDEKADNMEQTSESRRLTLAFDNFFRYFKRIKNCMPFKDALHRFLRKEQIRGIINKSVDIPAQFQRYDISAQAEILAFLSDQTKRTNDKKISDMNRKEALIEAYSSVPMHDMLKLQKLYQLDFQLFGYDPVLPMLYDNSVRNENRKKFYFN